MAHWLNAAVAWTCKAQVTATVGIDERGAADLLGVSARHMLEALACWSGRGIRRGFAAGDRAR